MTHSQAVLKKFFGYMEFRPGQEQIIESIISGKDTLALLPTGGGKSLCFQVPGLVLGGTTLVISPLISLMKDQVDQLTAKHIPATFLNSSLSENEMTSRFANFTRGQYSFLYLSPEKAISEKIIDACQSIPIRLVAIDEAHCISQWGHDFRPEYRQITKLITRLPTRPVVGAFTASATQETVNDICLQLQLKQPAIFQQSVKRSNLFWHAQMCQSTSHQQLLLIRILKKHHGETGIIYGATRRNCEETTQWLKTIGIPARYYHGGMDSHQRTEVQELFLTNQVKIICATNAFGMGINKPDVRCVIHLSLPRDMEGYYQEAGRAGRDGNLAGCFLLTAPRDIEQQLELFTNKYPDPAVMKNILVLVKKQPRSFRQLYRQVNFELTSTELKKILSLMVNMKLISSSSSQQKYAENIFHVFHGYQDMWKKYLSQRKQALAKLEYMMGYLESKTCLVQRQQVYFNEKATSISCLQCNHCQNTQIEVTAEETNLTGLIKKWQRETKAPFLTQRTIDFLVAKGNLSDTRYRVPGWGTGLQKLFSTQPFV